MRASIVCVGTELLFGQIVNTNAAWLSGRLQLLGIDVLYHYVVGDNPGRLRSTLELALSESDLVITSGGLGPTQDDLTKETIAELMGDTLVEVPEVTAFLKETFEKSGRRLTENNFKQALLPSRAEIIFNEVGTAPAFSLESAAEGGSVKTIIALPGPPRELTYLFENKVLPMLEKKTSATIYYKTLRFYGIGESSLETALLPVIDAQDDPTVATYAKEGECTVRVASKRATRGEAEAAVNACIREIRDLVGRYIYSEDDEELAEVVAKRLIATGKTIAAAESCTAGLFTATLADYAGISASLLSSYVTYSNESKVRELGVSASLIEEKGAVSEETALAMAAGARARSGADIGISVTGIAGPDGGSVDKPVGMAWIGIDCADGYQKSVKFYFRDRGRKYNRLSFVLCMMAAANEYLG